MAKITIAAIRDFIGQDLGTSDWVTVDQSMIDQFAACTGDHQWTTSTPIALGRKVP